MLKAKLTKRLIPIGVMVIAVVAANAILNNPPKANRRGPSQAPQMTVEVETLKSQMYQIQLSSFGTVQPRTQSMLVSQASGQINYINDNFRDGGFFEKGDVLLRLDDRDHIADVKIAQANLLDAKQQLAEEKAKADQALNDWHRLGKKGLPNALVLRKPQLEASKARVLSSEAQLAKSELALERTKITAPYAGRVLKKNVDLGQVVSFNNQLAQIYASDAVEVRLPIKNQDLNLIDLPEEFKGKVNQKQALTKVQFTSSMNDQVWQGYLVRTESAIDQNSQQLYVVAQIKDPYGYKDTGLPTVKIGQYVSAKLAGKLLTEALVIPTKSIYQGSYVYIVNEGVLKRREIELLWKNETDAVIKSGINEGDELVITALGQVSSGTRVMISGAMPTDKRKQLEKQAKERGISIKELMRERRKKNMANGGE